MFAAHFVLVCLYCIKQHLLLWKAVMKFDRQQKHLYYSFKLLIIIEKRNPMVIVINKQIMVIKKQYLCI